MHTRVNHVPAIATTQPALPFVRLLALVVALALFPGLALGQTLPDNARQALDMGLVNAVVPVAELEAEGVKWAHEILGHTPLAIRCLKSAFNAAVDGQAGIQELAGNATLLFYMTEQAQEAKNAFLEKRPPTWSDR